uniref:Nuclear receptor domain-containing protein n=1 Tax=Macrostomum lignano TaxID=282301 RepID=A0A1I8IXR8_9PLAT
MIGVPASAVETPSPPPRLPPAAGVADGAQQVAWTDQASAAIQSRVDHSLLADLEGGAQQASVRCVNLFLERLRQRPGLGVVQQDGLDHRLEQRRRRPLAISPGKPFGLQEPDRRGRRTADKRGSSVACPSAPRHKNRCLDVIRHAQSTTVFCVLTTRPTLAATATSLSRCRWAPSTVDDSKASRPEFPMQHAGHTALLVACPFKQNSCDLDAQHQLKSIQPQKELHFKEEEEQQQQQQQQQHACQMHSIQKCNFESSCLVSVITRKFCPACRLAKCFKVGMKREWI